jgi:hypothetical protein
VPGPCFFYVLRAGPPGPAQMYTYRDARTSREGSILVKASTAFGWAFAPSWQQSCATSLRNTPWSRPTVERRHTRGSLYTHTELRESSLCSGVSVLGPFLAQYKIRYRGPIHTQIYIIIHISPNIWYIKMITDIKYSKNTCYMISLKIYSNIFLYKVIAYIIEINLI